MESLYSRKKNKPRPGTPRTRIISASFGTIARTGFDPRKRQNEHNPQWYWFVPPGEARIEGQRRHAVSREQHPASARVTAFTDEHDPGARTADGDKSSNRVRSPTISSDDIIHVETITTFTDEHGPGAKGYDQG